MGINEKLDTCKVLFQGFLVLTFTIMVQRISIETWQALLARVTIRIEATLLALASLLVTALRVIDIGVIITLAHLTRSTTFSRVAIVVDGALFTPVANIAGLTLTCNAINSFLKVAFVSKLVARRITWTLTFFWDLTRNQVTTWPIPTVFNPFNDKTIINLSCLNKWPFS